MQELLEEKLAENARLEQDVIVLQQEVARLYDSLAQATDSTVKLRRKSDVKPASERTVSGEISLGNSQCTTLKPASDPTNEKPSQSNGTQDETKPPEGDTVVNSENTNVN